MIQSEDPDKTIGSTTASEYGDDSIRSLDWKEHIRRRPGMYIGKLGDGSTPDDGIYVLLKEVIDNSIDEFNMGAGKRIEIEMRDSREVYVRDHGRGIPLGRVADVASKINTGAKWDDDVFQKAVGLNGVGLKAVNALSEECEVTSRRDGMKVTVLFRRGEVVEAGEPVSTDEDNGTSVRFRPDTGIFGPYAFRADTVEEMVRNYTYLNTGLTIMLDGRKFISRHGLADLLEANLNYEPLYPPIHLKGKDIEVILTHTDQYGEEYFSFANGQHTTQGGTHLTAFREATGRTLKEYFKKNFEYSDIRNGMVAAVSIRIQEPVFEARPRPASEARK